MGASLVMGVPHSWMVKKRGNSHLEMDDDWGYPYFRKPPYIIQLFLGQGRNEAIPRKNSSLENGLSIPSQLLQQALNRQGALFHLAGAAGIVVDRTGATQRAIPRSNHTSSHMVVS